MRRLFLIAFLLVASVASAGDFINFPNFPTRGQGPFDRGGVWWNDSSLTFYAPFDDPANPLRLIKGTGTLSFTRATTATYVHPTTGLVTTAASGQLRIESNGALIEGQRTNVLRWSRALDNEAWVKTNTTAGKTITGEDGVANSASWVAASADNGTICQPVTIASAAYSGAFSLKRITGTGTVMISLDNGATYGSDVSGLMDNVTWGRFKKENQTLANPDLCLKLGTSGDNVAVDYAQVEAGAFIVSRISTTTAAVTRNADVLFVGVSGNIDVTVGTAAFTVDQKQHLDTDHYKLSTGNAGRIGYDGNTTIYGVQKLVDGTNTFSTTTVVMPTVNTPAKYATYWGGTVMGIYINGSGESGTFDGSFEAGANLGIGYRNADNSQFLYGHIKNLRIWSRSFSNEELQAITK